MQKVELIQDRKVKIMIKKTSIQKEKAVLLVLTSVSKKQDANRIAQCLLKEKLAACIQILAPMESHYVWKSKICQESEHLMLIKTLSLHYPALEKRLTSIHPYDCPEILSFSAEKALQIYQQWIEKNLLEI